MARHSIQPINSLYTSLPQFNTTNGFKDVRDNSYNYDKPFGSLVNMGAANELDYGNIPDNYFKNFGQTDYGDGYRPNFYSDNGIKDAVIAGGSRYPGISAENQPRLTVGDLYKDYLNRTPPTDAESNFLGDNNVIPAIRRNTQAQPVNDYRESYETGPHVPHQTAAPALPVEQVQGMPWLDRQVAQNNAPAFSYGGAPTPSPVQQPVQNTAAPSMWDRYRAAQEARTIARGDPNFIRER